ncbi:Ig-like domain repeat protein [Cellulomonas sp. P5_C5]
MSLTTVTVRRRSVRRLLAVAGIAAVAVAGMVQPAVAAGGAALVATTTTTTLPDAVLVGDPVTVSVTVAAAEGVPTGSVNIYLDDDTMTAVPLVGGIATLALDDVAVGQHHIWADYPGDGSFAPSFQRFGQDFWVIERTAPVVTDVLPAVLPSDHDVRVSLIGAHLGGATSVTFGGVPGTGLEVYSTGRIYVDIPRHPAGTVDVVVTTPAGTSKAVPVQFVDTHAGIVSRVPVRIHDSWAYPSSPSCLQVAETNGIPAGATGVIVNVTVVAPYGAGNLVLYPDRGPLTPVPTASTVNFEYNREVANAAFVALPDNGRICYDARGFGGARVLIDLTGFVMGDSGMELQDPVRLLDTRPGTDHVGDVSGPVPSGVVQTVQVRGKAGVPADATAVIVNATVTGTIAPGNLRIFPAGVAVPNASVVNYAPGNDKANQSIVQLSSSGKLSFLSDAGGSTAHVILDVVGYVTAGPYRGQTPTRVLDTRGGTWQVGPIRGALKAGRPYTVTLPSAMVPDGATSVVLNVTAMAPSDLGNLRVYPSGSEVPDASTVNYIPFRDIPNLVVVDLPDSGPATLQLYSDMVAYGSMWVAADVAGFVVAP